jgi:hypothetical protein
MDRNQVDFNLRDTFDALNNGTSTILTNGDKQLLIRTERQQRDMLNEMTIRDANLTDERLAREFKRLTLAREAVAKTRAHLKRIVGNTDTGEEF